MAHFAEIDVNNIVTRVLVFNDNYTDLDCTSLLGGAWIQTSYNNNIRNYSLKNRFEAVVVTSENKKSAKRISKKLKTNIALEELKISENKSIFSVGTFELSDKELPNDLNAGNILLLDDGKIILKVDRIKNSKKTNTLIFLFCELTSNDKIIASASGIWKILKVKPSELGPGG